MNSIAETDMRRVALLVRDNIAEHQSEACLCRRIDGVAACQVGGTFENTALVRMMKRGVRAALGKRRAVRGILLDNGYTIMPRGDKLERMIASLSGGKSCRQVQVEIGVHHDTVARLKKYMHSRGMIPLCKCGRDNGHKGWCKPLYDASPVRQAALKALHERQRNKL